MNEPADPHEEAAAALIDFGLHVVPTGDDLSSWEVGGVIYADHELLALAMRFGLADGPATLQ